MASAILGKLESDFACMFCGKTGDDPKLLPCNHPSCSPCLEKLVAGGNVKCKKCDCVVEVTSKGIDDFRDNIYAVTLHELRMLEVGKGGECAYSSAEDPHDHPVVFCRVCGESLCSRCRDQHRKSKYTKAHKLIAVEDLNQDQLTALSRRAAELCSKHPEEILQFFCDTCQELVCVQCALDTHGKHDRTRLEDKVPSCTGSIQDTAKTIDIYLTDMEGKISDIESCLSRYEANMVKIKHEVKDKAQIAIDRITNDANMLIAQLEEGFKSYKDKMTQIEQECREQIAKLNSLKDLANKVLQGGIAADIVASSSDIKKQVDGVENFVYSGDVWEEVEFTMAKDTFLTPNQNIIGKINPAFKCVLKGSFGVRVRPRQICLSSIPGCITIAGYDSSKYKPLAVYTLGGMQKMHIDTLHQIDNVSSVIETRDGAMYLATCNSGPMYFRWSADRPWIKSGEKPVKACKSLALCTDTSMILVDKGKFCLSEFSLAGDLIRTIDFKEQEIPCGAPNYVTINKNQDIIVSDNGLHCVNIISSEGALKRTLGTPCRPGNKNNQFNNPEDVATDKYGNILVTDRSNRRVQLFSQSGRFLGSLLTQKDGLQDPHGITITADQQLIVADYNSERIRIYDYKAQ